MLILRGTADLVQAVTAIASVAVDVHASWVDYVDAATTVTPGRTNTAIASNATTTIVGSPGSSTTNRNVKTLTLRNTDAALSQLVTVQHYNGTTTATLIKVTLQHGETLQYVDKEGFIILDITGSIKLGAASSRLIAVSLLTTASANFTTSTSTNYIMIRGVGGGGQGGGALGGSSLAGCGGGGTAGAYVEKTFGVTPNTAYAYTCGAGGSTSVGNTTGQVGTASTFIVGSTTVTATGGNGGVGGTAAAATVITALGGTAPAVSTNGDVNGSGQPGDPGIRLSGTVAMGGGGGNSFAGGGGNSQNTDAVGNAANGNGAGGGGGMALTTTARAGGAGTGGCWVVEEYT